MLNWKNTKNKQGYKLLFGNNNEIVFEYNIYNNITLILKVKINNKKIFN